MAIAWLKKAANGNYESISLEEVQTDDIDDYPLYTVVLMVDEIKSYNSDYIIPRLYFNIEVSEKGKVIDCGVADDSGDWIIQDIGDAERNGIDALRNPEDFFEYVTEVVSPQGGDDEEFEDEDIDESVIKEGKSRCKCDKFSHKEKVAYKKKKNYDKYDEDDDLDESFNGMKKNFNVMGRLVSKFFNGNNKYYKSGMWHIANGGYDLIAEIYYDNIPVIDIVRGPRIENCCLNSKEFFDACKVLEPVMKKDYGRTPSYMFDDHYFENFDKLVKYLNDEDDDLDEAYEDTFREPNNVQKGTDDWSDFKDDFRQKTLTLKKALTPKFVSGIIKDTDFEVDEKEIKAYAFKVVEEVFGTKEPVENLQSRIRTYFVK